MYVELLIQLISGSKYRIVNIYQHLLLQESQLEWKKVWH